MLLIGVVLGFLTSLSAEEFRVGDEKAFNEAAKKAVGGDQIILKNGTWKDSILKIKNSGDSDALITIKAETPGKVIFKGDSRISLGGRHLLVEGLWFQNPTGEESIQLRADSKNLGNDCRVTNCAVTNDDTNSKRKESSRFLSIYGSGHRIDHCYFAGKMNEGATAVIWLAEGTVASHRIDSNHFGHRERLGKNGGETLRIGDSRTSMLVASCVVENNLFEKCDGEAECISNKSCGNVYRSNHFIGVSGTLTLRHGNDCLVEGNVFLGDGVRGTGGVRIIGEGHVITGNHFQDLSGEDERSAMCFMMGIPDSPANGYFQVKRVKVLKNVFLNCEHNILIGMEGHSKATLPPINTEISGNLIQTNQGKAFEILCDASGVETEGNSIDAKLTRAGVKCLEPGSVGPSWWEN